VRGGKDSRGFTDRLLRLTMSPAETQVGGVGTWEILSCETLTLKRRRTLRLVLFAYVAREI